MPTAQQAPTVRQCTAVLTGVLIRHRVPITESLTADLMAVVTSREATLLEYLADHARRRVEQVLVHGVRSKAFRDGLDNAATWLSSAATAAARRDKDAAERQRALQRPQWSGPRATGANDDTSAVRPQRRAETG
jgi:hypothetical protein